jgi:antitoxin component of RelBE/YafQ-DinJ toxin-antitoxin module
MASDQTVDVTVRLDRDVKERGEAFFRSFGVNFSAAVNALVQQAVQGSIPFVIDGEPKGCTYAYKAELAEQWAAEDPLFCKETYRQDPYFDKKEQAFLRLHAKGMDNGANCCIHELIDAE